MHSIFFPFVCNLQQTDIIEYFPLSGLDIFFTLAQSDTVESEANWRNSNPWTFLFQRSTTFNVTNRHVVTFAYRRSKKSLFRICIFLDRELGSGASFTTCLVSGVFPLPEPELSSLTEGRVQRQQLTRSEQEILWSTLWLSVNNSAARCFVTS